jgi:hypothetical protein
MMRGIRRLGMADRADRRKQQGERHEHEAKAPRKP